MSNQRGFCSLDKFIAVFSDRKTYPTKAAAAEACGLTANSFGQKVSTLKKEWPQIAALSDKLGDYKRTGGGRSKPEADAVESLVSAAMAKLEASQEASQEAPQEEPQGVEDNGQDAEETTDEVVSESAQETAEVPAN